MVDVTRQVDASAITSCEPGAARLGALASAANFTGSARGGAVATMRGIIAHVNAATGACRKPGIARAPCSARADLRRGAGDVAVAAVGGIARRADATGPTQAEPVRATCRTHTEIADLASAAAQRAIAAVGRVGAGVDAHAIAVQLPIGATAGLPFPTDRDGAAAGGRRRGSTTGETCASVCRVIGARVAVGCA